MNITKKCLVILCFLFLKKENTETFIFPKDFTLRKLSLLVDKKIELDRKIFGKSKISYNCINGWKMIVTGYAGDEFPHAYPLVFYTHNDRVKIIKLELIDKIRKRKDIRENIVSVIDSNLSCKDNLCPKIQISTLEQDDEGNIDFNIVDRNLKIGCRHDKCSTEILYIYSSRNDLFKLVEDLNKIHEVPLSGKDKKSIELSISKDSTYCYI